MNFTYLWSDVSISTHPWSVDGRLPGLLAFLGAEATEDQQLGGGRAGVTQLIEYEVLLHLKRALNERRYVGG